LAAPSTQQWTWLAGSRGFTSSCCTWAAPERAEAPQTAQPLDVKWLAGLLDVITSALREMLLSGAL